MAIPQKVLPTLKPAFSIIIPIYNAEDTLQETLNSVASQTYPHFEVICVNDGSTDRSSEILDSWKTLNPELELLIINQQNKGLGGARNAGIVAAKYDWIALLDADDLWLPEKLDRCSRALSNSATDVLFHGYDTFGAKHNQSRAGHTLNTFEDLLIKGNPIMPSAVIVKSEVLKDFPFSTDNGIHGAEDLDLWMRLLHAKKRFTHLPDILASYRQTGGMSTRLEDHLEKVKTVINQCYQQGWFDDSIYHNAISRKNWEAGRFYHKRGEHKKARQYYQACSNLSPKQQLIVLSSHFKFSF